MIRYITTPPAAVWQKARHRAVVILGSTGSIGRNALDVIARQGDGGSVFSGSREFHVAALAGARNIALLAQQAATFRPPYLGVLDETGAAALRAALPRGYHPHIVTGQEGYEFLAALPEAPLVLSAQVGAAGLRATAAAAAAGKVIALANKESLVLAGGLIRELCSRSGASILPVDSEHNAIFQCFEGAAPEDVVGLILTASGGPFRGKTREELARVTVDSALAHPNWNMGAKISIDSATLMNKGLELIEAHHLYGLPLEDIRVLVHKESIVHSLVEYADGSQLAQLGSPDMRVAIAYCLGWPGRMLTGAAPLDLARIGTLTFTEPDCENFPCLALARAAQEKGGGYPVVLNAANEIAVEAFLAKRLSFPGIAQVVARTLEEDFSETSPASVADILSIDSLARERAEAHVRALVAA